MSPLFSLFDLVILACIAQGLITSLLLFKSKQAKTSKRLLGITLILLCIVSFRMVFHNVGWSQIPQIRYLPLAWELFIPPFFYFYVASLTQKNFKWRNLYLLHLIPGALYLVNDINVYLQTFMEPSIEQQWQTASALYYHQTNEIEDYLIIVSNFVYGFFSINLIINFREQTKSLNLKQADNVYQWLKKLMLLMGIAVILVFVNELIDLYKQQSSQGLNHWRLLNLYLAAAIYYIGFKGYRLESVSLHADKEKIQKVTEKLNNEQTKDVEDKLIQQLEQMHIYLEPEVTLNQLAETIGTSPETLSFVINQQFNQNFRDLMNSYRIKHVKSKLDDFKEGQSILNIALDSGFNSQASFYRAFKKFENMTPKAYLASKE